MKSKKKIALIAGSILITVLIILPTIVFGVVKWGILPPEKLTPLVTNTVNKFITGKLECEQIELTYFETYPHLGIRITNGRITIQDSDSLHHDLNEKTTISEDENLEFHSLLSFNKAIVAFNPTDYLFSKKITINEVDVDEPHFHGYVDKDGKANWDILLTSNDTTTVEEDNQPIPPIDIRRIKIQNGHFTYDDDQQDIYADIEGFSFDLSGALTQGGNKFEMKAGSSSILFVSPFYTLNNKLELSLKTGLVLSNQFNTVTLEGAELKINNLPFTADGSVTSIPESKSLQLDLDMGLRASEMNDLLAFIPDALFENREQMITKGSVLLEGSIHGELNDSIIPTVNLCCQISNGSFHMKGVEQGIDTLDMDLDIHINGTHLDSSYVSLENITLKGLNTSLVIHGKATNLLKNPEIAAVMKGKVDFTRLGQEFLNADTLLVQGVMDADISASFKMDDITNGQYDKIEAKGKLNIDTLKVYSKPLDTDIFIADARLSIGPLKRDTASRYLNVKELLNATLSMDTMSIQYKDEINTRFRKVELQANTLPVIDTSSVVPITGSIKFDKLRTKLPDSTWLSMEKAIFRGGIKSSESNKKIPTLAGMMTIDTLKYVIIPSRTGMIVTESVFTFQALPYRDAMRQRRARQDSTTVAQRRTRINRNDSLIHNNRDSVSLALRRDSLRRRLTNSSDANEANDLLRKWEAKGSVKVKQVRAFSRMFPLPMRMGQTNLKFNTDSVILSNAPIRIGKSDFSVSGEISRIRRAMLRNGTLKGNFTINSDSIDCTQLMQAITRGMLYMDQEEAKQNVTINESSLTNMETEINMQAADLDVNADTSVLFVVPKQLDIALKTKAQKIKFKDLTLENVDGEVVLRDQSINLTNLSMHSNMGNGDLTMIYTARDRQGASVGFDLDMKDILVDKLIDLFPSLDTLVPMLRSFEGVVDCQMTTTCRIDSTMSLILPSLHSGCYLNGQNMVLLDGETFTEISKTLMFKNKKHNLIDSISVDLVIRDSKVEVYPFLLEIDRYRVAVGGTHNLDMTFNYHISVLKSPVPFKLGVDVTGNLDDFKFKIGKCKYKDTFKPTRSAELDNTRTNIRKEIREAIRKQMIADNPDIAALFTRKEESEESPSQPQQSDIL